MNPDRSNTNPSLFWLVGLVAVIAAITAAFWLLLGYRYSPELYDARPITPDTIEFVWCGLSLSAAVVCVWWLSRQRALWPRLFWSAILLLAVVIFIVTKTLLGASLRCYDAILFCTAFGWTVTKAVSLVF